MLSLHVLSVTADFFEWGADFLSATRAFARVNEALARAAQERKKLGRTLPPLVGRKPLEIA